MKKNVYLNGKYLGEFILLDIKKLVNKNNYNLIVLRSNGYSHDWEESIVYDEEHILCTSSVYLTQKPLGRIMGSSIVSFS